MTATTTKKAVERKFHNHRCVSGKIKTATQFGKAGTRQHFFRLQTATSNYPSHLHPPPAQTSVSTSSVSLVCVSYALTLQAFVFFSFGNKRFWPQMPIYHFRFLRSPATSQRINGDCGLKCQGGESNEEAVSCRQLVAEVHTSSQLREARFWLVVGLLRYVFVL